jgi:hypothetical protein
MSLKSTAESKKVAEKFSYLRRLPYESINSATSVGVLELLIQL